MRFRARTPDGRQAVIQLDDAATILDLRTAIKTQLTLDQFELKTGFPPKVIDLTPFPDTTTLAAAEIHLNNESVQVIPPSAPTASQPVAPTATPTHTKPPPNPPSSTTPPKPSLTRRKPSTSFDPPELPLPAHQSTLVLRIMPDDNACLFRAISTAISPPSSPDPSDTHVTTLRYHVASYISANASSYSPAMLDGRSVESYCAWIQQPDSWGGEIEIDILARVLGVEIDACVISPFFVRRYNEGAADERIVLVYSGIHYDTVAVSPDPEGDLGTDMDVRRWEVEGSEWVLEGTRRLCGLLEERGYMTDTGRFGVRCEVCGWVGKGEREASAHAMGTGHMEFGEIK